MSPDVVMIEMFGQFAAVYPEAKKIIMEYFFANWKAMQPLVIAYLDGLTDEERSEHFWLIREILSKASIKT
jgi:hypothetical protein